MSLHYLALTDDEVARIRETVAAAVRTLDDHERYVASRALNDLDTAIAVDHETPYPFI